ncbi:MAG: nuclear transport factor 2 family protein [Candidatus Bathyarchaeia archaeon]
MSEEKLGSIIRGFAEAFAEGDVEKTLSFLTEDAVWVTPEGTFKGKEEIRRFVTWAAQTSPHKKFSDAGIGIMVSGNRAVHEHIFEAVTSQGMRFETPAICVYEFSDEKIQHHRALLDRLSVCEQVANGWIEKQVFRSIVNSWEKGLH